MIVVNDDSTYCHCRQIQTHRQTDRQRERERETGSVTKRDRVSVKFTLEFATTTDRDRARQQCNHTDYRLQRPIINNIIIKTKTGFSFSSL